MATETYKTAIEKLLKQNFVSDPRGSRFPLPEAPADYSRDRPYPHPSMVITPEMARDWLTYRVLRKAITPPPLLIPEMTANRRFLITSLMGNHRSPGLVDTLERGLWNPRTSTPIVFTRDGFILDGQHRLAACAISGCTIEAPLTTGGWWDTFAIIDTNKTRTPGQLLGDEIPYPDRAAAVAKLILPVLAGSERAQWWVEKGPGQDIYDLVHGWPVFRGGFDEEQCEWLREVEMTRRTGIPTVALGASVVMALAAGAPPDFVQEFIDGLKPKYAGGMESIGSRGEDPRLLLRNQYMGRATKGRTVTPLKRMEQVSHMRRAMEVWLEYRVNGRAIELLKLQRPAPDQKLPAVWNADGVRKYHEEMVSE